MVCRRPSFKLVHQMGDRIHEQQEDMVRWIGGVQSGQGAFGQFMARFQA
jgi:hypothetical protein